MRETIKRFLFRFLSGRTLRAIRFDLYRLRARVLHHRKRDVKPPSSRLHLGCGERKIAGWLNIDVSQSDFDVDLACGQLPFSDNVFDVIVSQHVIEHLELQSELIPLLHEIHRVCQPGAAVWFSCPDLEKVCQAYIEDRGKAMLNDRMIRFPGYDIGEVPSQQIINESLFRMGNIVT